MRVLLLAALLSLACRAPAYDVVIRGGTIFDGSGEPGVVTDLGIRGDSIVTVGNLASARAGTVIDASGLAVAPGFINMLSWAVEALLVDGRSQSDLRQGVTLEVFGEGSSMGPVNDSMRAEALASQGDLRYPITWSTLAGYLDTLVRHGISTNVASFIGAGTVRQYVLGHDPRAPTPAELVRMQDLVRQAMRDGALGVGSSLIYEPDMHATTAELTALAAAAAEYHGMYISHIRNEDDSLFTALDEFVTIARQSGARAEIYHLKTSGARNWPKEPELLARIDSARAAGLAITADMYTYPASATGLDAIMPGWVRVGGFEAWAARLRDPASRRRLMPELHDALVKEGGPGRVLLVAFKNDTLKPYTGKTLEEVARLRGRSAEETAMDLVPADGSRVGCIYFSMNEDNLRLQVQRPWVSFGSDEASQAPAGVFLKANPHPRAYGTFARVLAKYTRDEGLLSVAEAVRRMTGLPAENLRIRRRGRLAPGFHADVVVFDTATIQDHATFQAPQQYATGVRQVFVNGVQVIRDGDHTGATPGRVVWGPGRN